ncbi:class I SAM-dependent methyltransferase [Streptomyces sp. NPDC057654]|uniref:class I SAM-dependent methyltransferase n=1 Tax=Streptomyces sp. NPDC057654 TaxID=3346196 RepID=UPI003679D553
MTHTAHPIATADWAAWQASWDRQQEWYMPDREERFRVMLDMVEALVGPKPRVLDLACGTGSISDRLLKRLPEAVSTGVDLDPALLTIARGSFDGDARVEFVTADLTDPDWPARLPYDSYDAVLTGNARKTHMRAEAEFTQDGPHDHERVRRVRQVPGGGASPLA